MVIFATTKNIFIVFSCAVGLYKVYIVYKTIFFIPFYNANNFSLTLLYHCNIAYCYCSTLCLRYRCKEPYPAQHVIELDLSVGDIVYVTRKREDGWFKGTLQRSGKTGLFPGSFVEKLDWVVHWKILSGSQEDWVVQ